MIPAEDYRFLSEFVYRETGLSLGGGKEYLLETRLGSVAERFGHGNLAGLVQVLRRNGDRTLARAVAEAMTTQETLFFRDNSPFKTLKEKLLAPLLEARRRTGQRLRVWSAASSTGQEAYSVAMTLCTFSPPVAPAESEIVATDYSPGALERARAGLYTQFEVQRGLPVQMLVRFFRQGPAGFQIADEIRQRVRFAEQNLLEPFAALGLFDLLFCRNVLIYFDTETKKGVLNRLADSLMPEGYMLLGSAETPYGLTDRLVRAPGLEGGVYVLREYADRIAKAAAATAAVAARGIANRAAVVGAPARP